MYQMQLKYTYIILQKHSKSEITMPLIIMRSSIHFLTMKSLLQSQEEMNKSTLVTKWINFKIQDF